MNKDMKRHEEEYIHIPKALLLIPILLIMLGGIVLMAAGASIFLTPGASEQMEKLSAGNSGILFLSCLIAVSIAAVTVKALESEWNIVQT